MEKFIGEIQAFIIADPPENLEVQKVIKGWYQVLVLIPPPCMGGYY